MGSNQSVQTLEDEEENEEDEEEDDENGVTMQGDSHTIKKVLEQEPEMLPCYASASPLSPQLSSLGTPRMGPSIKVWDPYNVLAPPPPLPPPPHAVSFGRSYSSDGMLFMEDDREKGNLMEVYLINHGESEMSLRPDLISGRCPDSGLTTNGKRQARALAVFLNSQGVRFNAVYTSPLDRAKFTAVSVCQEINFPEEQIQSADALTEMSQGHWEGCPRSEMYTPDILNLVERLQPDFAAPSGESLRQVEFRMVQFLNGSLLVLPEKLRSDFLSPRPNDTAFTQQNSHAYTSTVIPEKSGKSRLQMVTTNGEKCHEDELSPKEPSRQSSINDMNSLNGQNSSTCIGVFSHSVPIKCLLMGVLGCSPVMSHKVCVEESSVTVLQHSWKTGWQVKRLNDTAHLRLL
ncbi:2 3-bisphosphoglycerate-dependent phosphoglycerate mutase [Bienertia sinuspersici]